MESLHQSQTPSPHYDLEDYTDTPFYNLLRRMPKELAERHLTHIISNGLSDEIATAYLEQILAGRREATTVTEISDSHAQELFEAQGADFFRQIETSVFTDSDNYLGAGMTARVKRFDVTHKDDTLPMAIKYLVTPTAKTLSASAEHDMIKEVERIKEIEEIERGADFKHLAVPHPYFHHKTTQIQCYGMQLIDGPDLENGVHLMTEGGLDQTTLETWAHLDLNELYEEIDGFFSRMHTYCLHGDMKPKNLMIDSTGKLYVIDFGQSVLTIDIDDKARDQFDNLKEMEIAATKEIIKDFIKKARKKLTELADVE